MRETVNLFVAKGLTHELKEMELGSSSVQINETHVTINFEPKESLPLVW